ncbi:uncharacterized protein [Periplaneta americana]|uniref:uncharacterized protein isoform X2 n=1 Tax=Periplaneta americana TaxID=6978 RepID=UPI0037E83A1D
MYVSVVGLAGAVFMLAGKATSKYCDGGHYCSPPKECCTLGCCYMYIPGYRPPAVPPAANVFSIVFWNHWCLLVVLLVSCVGGCSLWRRWRCCCCRGDPGGGACDDEPSSERESAASCYPPPQYSRCSSFHHAPPPYTEVTSKPDLYPLVISYGDNGKGAVGGNYLMVQYFRNYIVRPVGSLSATSTADSLSSSFLCNAANEANTVVPPPYSCAGSLDEFQTSTPLSSAPPPPLLLRSVSSIASFDNREASEARNLSAPLPGDARPLQSFASTTGSEVSSLAGVGTPGSPPRATSPTLEIRELLDKIQQLPFQHEERQAKHYRQRGSGKNLYMPLGPGTGVARHHKWLPRSAPTTPSTHFPPSFLSGAAPPPRPASSGNRRRQSSGTTKEDGSPLLAEHCSDDEDHEQE